MLYDRPYMRRLHFRSIDSFCDLLILTLIGCFLVQSILALLFESTLIEEILPLSFKFILEGYIWAFLTYGFLHEGPIHLLFNILGIHFIGRHVESSFYQGSFPLFCLCCLFFGGLLWLPFNLNNQSLVGFSAVILGLLTYYCLLRPNQPISLLLFFVLPLKLKPKYLLLGTLGIELYGLLFSELRSLSNVAHSAHLGGMTFGALYYFYYQSNMRLPIKFTFTPPTIHSPLRTKQTHDVKRNYRVNFSEKFDLQDEVDRILDKINEHGFGSLDASEKSCLEKAKKILGRK